jgi:YHS domain-containing protein
MDEVRRGGCAMAIDPVCGMEVDEALAAYQSEYMGEVYYFCSAGCKDEFDSDPQAFMLDQGRPETDL